MSNKRFVNVTSKDGAHHYQFKHQDLYTLAWTDAGGPYIYRSWNLKDSKNFPEKWENAKATYYTLNEAKQLLALYYFDKAKKILEITDDKIDTMIKIMEDTSNAWNDNIVNNTDDDGNVITGLRKVIDDVADKIVDQRKKRK